MLPSNLLVWHFAWVSSVFFAVPSDSPWGTNSYCKLTITSVVNKLYTNCSWRACLCVTSSVEIQQPNNVILSRIYTAPTTTPDEGTGSRSRSIVRHRGRGRIAESARSHSRSIIHRRWRSKTAESTRSHSCSNVSQPGRIAKPARSRSRSIVSQQVKVTKSHRPGKATETMQRHSCSSSVVSSHKVVKNSIQVISQVLSTVRVVAVNQIQPNNPIVESTRNLSKSRSNTRSLSVHWSHRRSCTINIRLSATSSKRRLSQSRFICSRQSRLLSSQRPHLQNQQSSSTARFKVFPMAEGSKFSSF